MNDFLVNLALRSIGLADTIRPRVPSLFETSRMDSGIASVPPSLPDQSGEEVLQQGILHSVMAESLEYQPPNRQSPNEKNEPHQRKGHQSAALSETLPHRTVSRTLQRDPILPSQVRPSLIGEVLKKDSSRQGGITPTPPAAAAAPTGEGPERDATQDLRDIRGGQRSASFGPRINFGHLGRRAGLLTSSTGRRAGSIEPRRAHDVAARGSTGLRSSAPEPMIRVTIGRVDVRAIFSDTAPVRRVPSPPSKRTTPLDDYLQRSSRGRR